VAHSLRLRFNTIYLWIGLDVSCEHPNWIGLGQQKMDPCPAVLCTVGN